MQRKYRNFEEEIPDYLCEDLTSYDLGKGPLASALCYTQDGRILAAKYVYLEPNFVGEIFVLDSISLYISKIIINQPASALCCMAEGTLLVANCDYSNNLGYAVGTIAVINSHTGEFIKRLVNEPASALCYRPDGNLLASTCYYSLANSSLEGSIVIRDGFSGKYIQTLINEPASALCYLPDGTLLSSTCYSRGEYLEGEIVMRNPQSGHVIRKLNDYPASAMCFTPNSGLIWSAFYNNIRVGIGVTTSRWSPNEYLYRIKFINITIKMANIYYSSSEEKNQASLSTLPVEIIYLIIVEYNKKTLGINESDAFKCFTLIMENFRLRRHLIKTGYYDPKIEGTKENTAKSGEGIWKWWSKTPRENEAIEPKNINSSVTLFSQPPKIVTRTSKKARKCFVM